MMNEIETLTHPDVAALFDVASGQMGYFTTAQARDHGFRGNLLTYHVKTGRFLRAYRGVYRFRDFPSSPREEVMAAWLAIGKDKAVVSHESALDLLELSDVIPNAVHLTVPRSVRNLPSIHGVKIHTTVRPYEPRDLRSWDGMRHTSAERTILDAAEVGVDIVQVHKAIQDAVSRGKTTRSQMARAVQTRSLRVQNIVLSGLEELRP